MIHAKRSAFLFLAALAVALPARATTMIRTGLAQLTAGNSTVLVGEVLGHDSHWNAAGTHVLTDVRVRVLESFKGRAQPGTQINVTVLGGKVGDLTVMIPGGPRLQQGERYVMFLTERDLPGVSRALTVHYLSQGVFDLVGVDAGARAISQAIDHPMLPDRQGIAEPPGGRAGLPLAEMRDAILRLVNSGAKGENGHD